MNRHERRAALVQQHAHVRALPDRLTLIPPEEYPPMPPGPLPIMAWKSKHYMVQLYDESTPEMPGLKRLSIMRAKLDKKGGWQQGLSWDELQAIKREVGYGEAYAVEVYPRDYDVVNDANMRHLWVLPAPLPIGWTLRRKEGNS